MVRREVEVPARNRFGLVSSVDFCHQKLLSWLAGSG